MRKNGKKLSNALMLLAVLGLMACTEDRVEQQLLRYEVYEKSDIDAESNYLYVPLGRESSRTSLYGRSFSVGNSQVVNLEINEFSLDVFAIERDDRFNDNPTNRKLVMSIPVSHVDYRCQDDAYGECVGNEVTNERITWDQRRYIIPQFENAQVFDTNFFAYEFAGQGECYDENRVDLVERSIDAGSLNFTLKREFKDKLRFFCYNRHDTSDWNNLLWTETTSYSFVKLDQVASSDYETINYSPDWVRTFGFFEVDDNRLDVDGNPTQSDERTYMQRWNPNREEIVYHLNENFNKPQNAVIKAATYESFRRINQGLEKAQVNFRLRIEEPNEDINPGDLRHTMLILVDDPAASSVIGYGPSIINPLTGEVVSARTIMYGGSIRKFAKSSYDEIVEQYQEQRMAESGDVAMNQGVARLQELAEEVRLSTPTLQNLEVAPNLVDEKAMAREMTTDVLANIDFLDLDFQQNIIDRNPQLSEQEIIDHMERQNQRDVIAELSGQNMYPAEISTFGDVNQEQVLELVAAVGELRPWEQLNEEQKQAALNVLVPYVWIPTLVHEIGHNLGLRHNFAGSEDSDHYYTNEELVELGLPVSDSNIPYSSVMDYPKSEVNALRTLGKYDIAALRFGYNLEVEQEGNSRFSKVTLDQSPSSLNLKDYGYCTDDGVRPNPNCNRFDEGTNLLEIVDSLIDQYEENYSRRNFRKDRANFSSLNDSSYVRRIARTFNSLRLVYERYESIVREFDIDQETIDSVDWLSEMDQAVAKVSDFLIKVASMPDTVCAVSVPGGDIDTIPLRFFSPSAHDRTFDCFNLSLNPGFVVVAQGGKPVNSYKLPSNPNNFADQIDVRGTWADRVMAVRTLFRRTVGSSIHDDTNGNFLDHPASRDNVLGLIDNLLSNQLTSEVDMKTPTGEVISMEYQTNLDQDFYEIPQPELSSTTRILRLPYRNQFLQEQLLEAVVDGLYTGSTEPETEELRSSLRVYDSNPDAASPAIVSLQGTDRQIFVDRRTSPLSASLVDQADRALFFEGLDVPRERLIELFEVLRINLGTPPEDLEEILADLELNEEEQSVVNRGIDDLFNHLVNPVSSVYSRTLLGRLADIY